MTSYAVTWTIDIEADTPADAARIARQIQLDPANIASFYEVRDATSGASTLVDTLAEGEP